MSKRITRERTTQREGTERRGDDVGERITCGGDYKERWD